MWFSQNYEWLRAFHIIAVIAWMAGIMYLPRLFVYHSNVSAGSPSDDMFKLMEARLYKLIIRPSMIVVWIFGLCLIMGRGGFMLFTEKWFLVKFVIVISITIISEVYGMWVKSFARGLRPFTHVFYRIINELPFLLMIVAVFMVVLEPRI